MWKELSEKEEASDSAPVSEADSHESDDVVVSMTDRENQSGMP